MALPIPPFLFLFLLFSFSSHNESNFISYLFCNMQPLADSLKNQTIHTSMEKEIKVT